MLNIFNRLKNPALAGSVLGTCDLTKVPRLSHLVAYELKGMQLANFVTLREIGFHEGALVGRIALCL